MMPPDLLWIPITLAAALAQTVRNAAQRHLIPQLGTLGATFVRFLYGLPFVLLWLAGLHVIGDMPLPQPSARFLWWVVLGAVTQIAATALLLRVMTERNFALGIAYSKTEVLQVAIFGLVFLGDPLGAGVLVAVACATLGVLMLAPLDRQRPLRTLLAGWTTRTALLGIASGTCFGISAVGFRGAALAVGDTHFLMAAAYALAAVVATQTVLLGGWLAARSPGVVSAVCRAWRVSLLAGLLGATASAGWFTAFAIEPVAHVRTLGLVELFYGYAISRRFFRERITRIELLGMALLAAGLAIVTLAR